MTAIIDIIGREILDSRGNPTVEVDVVLEDGAHGPRGGAVGRLDGRARGGRAARRRQEALPRQGRRARRSMRSTARSSMRSPAWTPRTSARIDAALIKLDGTPNKGRLGANAILGVSLAVAKAAADASGLPLYRYLGGAAAHVLPGADDEHHQRRRACRQPDRHPGIHDHAGRRAGSCADAVRMGAEIFHTLKKALKDAGHSTSVGDEGGFAPNLKSADEALGFIMKAIERRRLQAGRRRGAGARLRGDRVLQGRQVRRWRARASRSMAAAWSKYLEGLVSRFPIVSIEDGMAEDDWAGLEGADRRDRRASASWSATICSSPTPSAWRRASKRGHRQLDPGQGQPDRLAVGDARRRRDGAARGLHGRHLAPLGRDRGRHHRRPRGRDQRRPDQDWLAVALRPPRQVQPAHPHRGASWATWRAMPGKSVIRGGSH